MMNRASKVQGTKKSSMVIQRNTNLDIEDSVLLSVIDIQYNLIHPWTMVLNLIHPWPASRTAAAGHMAATLTRYAAYEQRIVAALRRAVNALGRAAIWPLQSSSVCLASFGRTINPSHLETSWRPGDRCEQEGNVE